MPGAALGIKDRPATSGFHFFPGIEMKFKNKLFPLIVCPAWIPELNSVEHGEEGKEVHLSPQRGWDTGNQSPGGDGGSPESLPFGFRCHLLLREPPCAGEAAQPFTACLC